MRARAALVMVAALAAPALASPSENPQATLEEGRVAYERGNYDQAVSTIHPLLYPSIELRSEEAVVEAHRILALSYLFMTKTGEAEEEASSLLALRPNYEPDPVVDPPAAVSFFQSIKKKQDDRLREIRERQKVEEEHKKSEEERKQKEQHQKAERVYVERVVEHHLRAFALIPFGVGQFYNHHVGWGVAFAVSEFVLGAAWASLTVTIDQLYPKGKFTHDQVTEANTLAGLQVGSAAAFWAMVAWGIIDAQVRFVPEFVVRERELPGAPPPAPAPKKKTLSFAPILSPGLYGLGIQGAF